MSSRAAHGCKKAREEVIGLSDLAAQEAFDDGEQNVQVEYIGDLGRHLIRNCSSHMLVSKRFNTPHHSHICRT